MQLVGYKEINWRESTTTQQQPKAHAALCFSLSLQPHNAIASSYTVNKKVRHYTARTSLHFVKKK